MKISAKAKEYRLIVKVKTSAHETIDTKELDRFARVYLRCFLKPKLEKKNQVEYTGPIGISLDQRLKKEVTKRDFLFIIEHIVVALQKLRSNNFPVYNFNADPQYIFINETTKELQFLYVPLIQSQRGTDILQLFNFMIYRSHPAMEKDMDYISRFTYFFNSVKPFDVDKIEQFVYQEDRSVVNTIKKYNAGQSGFMTSDHGHYHDHMDKQKQAADAEATNLLADTQQNYGAPNGYGAGNAYGSDNAYGVSNSEDATGILFEDSSYLQQQNANAQPVFNGSQVHVANDTEEATGLLTEVHGFGDEKAPAYVPENSGLPQANTFNNEEVTGLLNEPMALYSQPPAVGVYQQQLTTPAFYDQRSGSIDSNDESTGLLIDNVPLSNHTAPTPSGNYPELVRVLTQEKITVNKPVFRIGKERSYVDYFVSNNGAVSRSHADIITRGSSYFVMDLNSKNKTYINNQPLTPHVETPIKNGDSLRLGNEEFLFRTTSGQTALVDKLCPGCRASIDCGSKFCPFCGRKM